ncbi:uncharacterized protein YagA-like [Stegodyphus dumicola]|uniref:uncharacterized protein YagA-like n=1 Tax=Stegodyphus dumicola TaxID=202533 RepID=UPI0015B2BBA2|nr:uncharacterized protein YagA-like [Stegodyphus dumicola]
MCGIKLQHTTAYHPQANGKAERLHRSLKTALMAHNSMAWTETLPTVFLGLRTVMQEDSAYTIAQMVYRQNIRLPGEFFPNSTTPIPLEPPYDDPFQVVDRKIKKFTVKINYKDVTVSIDRLNPAYFLQTPDITTKQSTPSIRQPVNPPTDLPPKINKFPANQLRTGRTIKPPVRFRDLYMYHLYMYQ